MSQRRFLLPIVAFLSLGPPAVSGMERQAETSPDMRRANVLFVVCDDLNTHVSTSGYRHIATPSLARLAASGQTFHRAYCQYPVCGPSRASFLSGLYPESTGVLDNKSEIRKTRPGTLSMPEIFRRAGYWTARTGKIFHNADTNPGDVWDENPDRFQNDELPLVTKAREAFEQEHGPVAKQPARRLWRAHLPTIATQTRGQTRPGYGPSGLTDAQHKDGKNARQVVQWLGERADAKQPFFIALGLQKPHVPFLAPQPYFDRYPLDSLTFERSPADDWDDIPRLAMSKRYQGFGFEFAKENDALRREYVQAYHACISFIDAQLGLVLDALEEDGLADDTIVVFTSDHGYNLGEHFMWGKVLLFEESARVPMIVRVPGRTKSGTTSESLVELVDLLPTLAELTGVEPPANLGGRSFVRSLDDPSALGRETAYTVVTRGARLGRSIRTKRWRYAEWGSPDQVELYDLQNDPQEYTNLANDPEHIEIVRRMQGLLADRTENAKSLAMPADRTDRPGSR